MQASKTQLKDLGRLKKRSDFLYAAQAGQKWVSDSVIIQLCATEAPAEDASEVAARPVSFGVTATKRLGNAVRRTRIKRRLRAALKDTLANAPELMKKAPQGRQWHIVLIGRAATAQVPYEKLKKDIKWCLKRLQDKQLRDT